MAGPHNKETQRTSFREQSKIAAESIDLARGELLQRQSKAIWTSAIRLRVLFSIVGRQGESQRQGSRRRSSGIRD